LSSIASSLPASSDDTRPLAPRSHQRSIKRPAIDLSRPGLKCLRRTRNKETHREQ
jgi:hypothetical protein